MGTKIFLYRNVADIFRDTEANLEILTEVETGSLGYADDSEKLGLYTASGWVWLSGDMKKAIYDINNNGIVDNAEALNGITPTSTPAPNVIPISDADGTLNSWVTTSGIGDMQRSVYDINNNNIVDNAEALNGITAVAIPTPNKIPIADENGTLDSWVTTSGTGDMLKSVYDTDNNGIVDKVDISIATINGLIGGGLLDVDRTFEIDLGYNFDWTGIHIFNNTLIASGNVKLSSTLTDINDSAGTDGQILSSTGLGIKWINMSSGSTVEWSSLGNPVEDLSLFMGAYSTLFTWSGAVGSGSFFTLTDTPNDMGTGYLLDIISASGSQINPLHVLASGVDALTIDKYGNVNIGPTTSGVKLFVKTTDITTIPLQVEARVSLGFDPDLMSGWSYRKSITIDNAGSALTNYQVLITINTASYISAGKMQSDCDDVRFTDSDGTTLLDYWIESGCNTSSTKIWIKVPSIPGSSSKTIYMYYGNSSATSASNGSNTFDFFDDFEGTSLDTNKWLQIGGDTPEVSNSILTTYANHTDPSKLIAITAPTGDNYVLRAKYQITGGSDVGERAGLCLKARTSDGRSYNHVVFHFDTTDMVNFLDECGGNGWYNHNAYWNFNTWYIGEVVHDGTYFKGKLIEDWMSVAWSGCTGYPALNIGSVDAVVEWDWALVHKYASPEPTYLVGIEEIASAQEQQIIFFIQEGTGNIGIWRTDPQYLLDIDGTGRFSGELVLDDMLTVSGLVRLNNTLRVLEDALINRNVGIGTYDQFGGGVKVIGIANASSIPSSNPLGGGVLYAENGELKWRGSSGTVTTIAPA